MMNYSMSCLKFVYDISVPDLSLISKISGQHVYFLRFWGCYREVVLVLQFCFSYSWIFSNQYQTWQDSSLEFESYCLLILFNLSFKHCNIYFYFLFFYLFFFLEEVEALNIYHFTLQYLFLPALTGYCGAWVSVMICCKSICDSVDNLLNKCLLI